MGHRKVSIPQATQGKFTHLDAAGGSNHDEPEIPKPKRRRTDQATKIAAQKQQDRSHLAGLMNMPMDIFTEVASHLMPEDIIVLARLNKFFRNLLMNRSSIHIRHGAMRNVPMLPPCPPDMCEPQYLALIYSPTCSMCGESGPKRMDEILRVRFCSFCINDSTMPVGGLPEDIEILVHKSSKIGSRGHWKTQYSALRSDVGAVLVKTEELKKSKDDSALDKWVLNREEALATRQEQAIVLSAFLDHLEAQEISRQNNMKLERRAEIERRLVALGWEKKDLRLVYYNTQEWDMLVEQPALVTECIWTEIKPELIRMLEENRTIRLASEKLQRRYARGMKLAQMMGDIKAADPLLIDTRILPLAPRSGSDPTAPATHVTHQRLFPLAIDLLAYPTIKNLAETDVPASEMEARFEEHREEKKALVFNWRTKIEGHLAELLRQGRISDDLKKPAPAPKLSIGKSQPNPLNGVSDDLKLLLRADSLFESKIGSIIIPVTYDSLLSAGFSDVWRPAREAPLDLATYKRHAKAQEVARAVLAGMGKTNACFVELQSVGKRFKCGRCDGDSGFTWERMIRHYIDEEREWEKFREYIPKAQELGITFQHVRALDAKPKKLLVKVLDSVQDSSYWGPSGPSNFRCLLCTKVGLNEAGVKEGEVIQHVTKWHGVEDPECEEHYDKFGRDYSEDEDDDESGDGSDSYGYGCNQGCCAFGPGYD